MMMVLRTCVDMVSFQNKAEHRAAARTRASLHQCKWAMFEHPPCSLELAPADYHLFIHSKQFVAGQSLASDQETKDAVQDWLKGLSASFFDGGIQNLVRRCDKCLDLHGDCVEQFNVGTSMLQWFFFLIL
jgi:hypothetical protein